MVSIVDRRLIAGGGAADCRTRVQKVNRTTFPPARAIDFSASAIRLCVAPSGWGFPLEQPEGAGPKPMAVAPVTVNVLSILTLCLASGGCVTQQEKANLRTQNPR